MFLSDNDNGPEDALPHPDPAAAHQAHLLELLTICEQFLRTASPTVHNELRQFLTAHGNHSIAGLPAFLDSMQFTLAQPRPP